MHCVLERYHDHRKVSSQQAILLCEICVLRCTPFKGELHTINYNGPLHVSLQAASLLLSLSN
jgi:hypothetical protein